MGSALANWTLSVQLLTGAYAVGSVDIQCPPCFHALTGAYAMGSSQSRRHCGIRNLTGAYAVGCPLFGGVPSSRIFGN